MDDLTGMDLKTISFIEISGSCWKYKIWASAGEKGREHTSGLKSPFPPKVSKRIRLFGGRRGSDLQGQGQQQACCISHWWWHSHPEFPALEAGSLSLRWSPSFVLIPVARKEWVSSSFSYEAGSNKKNNNKNKKKMQKRAIGVKRQHNKLVEGQHAGYICMCASVPVQY